MVQLQDVYHCFLSSGVLEFNEESVRVEPVTGWFVYLQCKNNGTKLYMFLQLQKMSNYSVQKIRPLPTQYCKRVKLTRIFCVFVRFTYRLIVTLLSPIRRCCS